MLFNPDSITTFRFTKVEFIEASSTARLSYAFDDKHSFTEEFIFDGTRLPLNAQRRHALDLALNYLHLAAGVSYFKAAVPGQIRIETGAVSRQAAAFFKALYINGLGEFAYRNRLSLTEKIKFPFQPNLSPDASDLSLPRCSAIPVGGGKDSIVTLEAIKQAREPAMLFSVGSHPVTAAIAERAGLPHLVVRRKISPLLLELNAAGAYNGHIPISAIIAFTGAAAAILYGFDAMAMSNERSASSGNLLYEGREINHQFSKSLEFERAFSTFVKSAVLKNFSYFSFLRPLSELAIGRLFSRCSAYHDLFTSCNKAFQLTRGADSVRWCRQCPKCLFVFLALAPFIERRRLISIFGANLLDDPAQVSLGDDLAGYGEHKPFECVGEYDEVKAAFFLLSREPAWRQDFLVRRFQQEFLPKIAEPEQLIAAALRPSDQHALPPRFQEILDAYSRAVL